MSWVGSFVPRRDVSSAGLMVEFPLLPPKISTTQRATRSANGSSIHTPADGAPTLSVGLRRQRWSTNGYTCRNCQMWSARDVGRLEDCAGDQGWHGRAPPMFNPEFPR